MPTKCFKFFVAIFLLLVINSCALKQTTIAFEEIKQNKRFKFQKQDLQGYTVSKNVILTVIADKMMGLSRYKDYKEVLNRYSKEIYDVNGIKTVINENRIILQYINGEKFTNGTVNITKVIVEFPVILSEDENCYIIGVYHPDKIEHLPHTNAVGIPIAPLDKIVKLKMDIENIFNKLDDIRIKRFYKLTGEINSKYKAESIFGNYKRILGKRSDGVKELVNYKSIFNFKFKGEIIPLGINVYPYRDGSKVLYEMHVPYEVNSNCSTTISQNDIERIKQEIGKIVTD